MYRQITLFTIFVLCFLEVKGQVQQGDKFLSGSIAFSHSNIENISSSNSNSEPSTNTRFNFSPQIGFLVSDFMAIGAQLNYRFSKNNQRFFSSFGGTFISESKENVFGIAPFAKVYWKLAKRAGFTLNISTGIGIGKQESDEINSSGIIKRDVFELNFIITPQFYYFITPRIGIEASFGGLVYQYQQYRGTEGFEQAEINQSNFSSTFGSGLALSFKYYFGKRFGGDVD